MTDQPTPPADAAQLEAFRKMFNAKTQFGHTAVQAWMRNHDTQTINGGDVLGRVYTLEAMFDRLLEMFAEATGAPLAEVSASIADHLDQCTRSVKSQATAIRVATADVLKERR